MPTLVQYLSDIKTYVVAIATIRDCLQMVTTFRNKMQTTYKLLM